MIQEPEQYWERLLMLVKREMDLYTRYAVRLREDGGIRHIYQTKIFKEELQNILEDDFASMDRKAYDRERKALSKEWEVFHKESYQCLKAGKILPFAYILHRFALTEFERYCACLAVAPEWNREFERMYCFLQDDYHLNYPTLDLCLKMFTMDSLEQKKLLQQTMSRKERLYFLFQEKTNLTEGSLSWKLRLRENLTAYFTFYQEDLHHRRKEYALYVPGKESEEEPELHPQIRKRLERELDGDTKRRLFLFQGAPGSGRRRQIRLAAGKHGRTVLFADLREIRKKTEEQRKEIIRDIVVRAVLYRAYLCFCHWETLCIDGVWDRGMIHELLQSAGLFFSQIFAVMEGAECPEKGAPDFCRVESFSIEPPDGRQRIRLWMHFLSGWRMDPGVSPEVLAAQFDFTPGMILDAVESAAEKTRAEGGEQISVSVLYEACRQQVAHRLGERARRVEAVCTWEDLVLEEAQKKLLRQACSQISCRCQVYETWGFQNKMAYGRGVSMLFLGPPGTGKTMAAQVIANELHLELYKADLSGVLSKYIGETQKNLKEIFDEVQKSKSILFFDEADVLFSRRVDVTDARDISANAQTAYLLQKMEEYDGITILATNLLQNFDDAYKRRMKYIIRFSLPQKEQRKELWRKVFPREMPLAEDVDMEYLASNFELSGASIKNIALNAAFLAASEGQITGMGQIMYALQQEYQKAGKILGKAELKEYAVYKI